jgi:hypothetical protein
LPAAGRNTRRRPPAFRLDTASLHFLDQAGQAALVGGQLLDPPLRLADLRRALLERPGPGLLQVLELGELRQLLGPQRSSWVRLRWSSCSWSAQRPRPATDLLQQEPVVDRDQVEVLVPVQEVG